MNYFEQLKTKDWKRKRVEILIRDRATCKACGEISTNPHIHHKEYLSGLLAWEYPDELLITLCNACHYKVHKSDLSTRVKSIGQIIKKNYHA